MPEGVDGWLMVEKAQGATHGRPDPPNLTDLALFRAAVEVAGEAVLITSPELDPPGPVIVYANPAFTRMTGYGLEEALGRSPRFLQGPRTDRTELDRMRAELSTTGAFRGEAVNYRRDGTEYVIDWVITAVRDGTGRVLQWVSVQRDITERKRWQEHEQLLTAELQHRVRNTLAVVRSIARRTAGTSGTVEDYAMHLEGRLDAFARIQAEVTRAPLAGVSLEPLVAEELLAYGAHEGDQVAAISGPPVRLAPKAAESFALALHELATNAVKHGALSVPDGRIQVCWRVEVDGEAPRLVFEWMESGVTDMPAGPARQGFGTELLERALAHALGARTALAFAPDGLRCRSAMPFTEQTSIRRS